MIDVEATSIRLVLTADREAGEHTFLQRLAGVVDELEDIIECAQEVADDAGRDFGAEGSNGVGAIVDKAVEASGPLMSALIAARQANL